VHANDRVGLERLARYGLRPPLAEGRLTEASDGAVIYQMKRRYSDGRHVLRFAPRELLLRLCALVPPRGFNMTRYAGIFSAHARGRHALTGRGMHESRQPPPEIPPGHRGAPPPDLPTGSSEHAVRPLSVELRREVRDRPVAAGTKDHAQVVASADDLTRPRRLPWATLLKRSWAIDVFVCPRCQGPMRPIAVIEDPLVARRILEHLGLPSRAPPRASGHSRKGQQVLFHDAGTNRDGVDDPGFAE
jgi:hypothetical protein